MADNKTVLFVDLVKNSNQMSDNFGRYYGRAVRTQTLSTRALARHIADHNSIYGRDVIEGVLIKFSECIPELVAQGIGVKLDGLGIFYPTLQNKKNGVAAPTDFNASSDIVGVHLRFQPEGTDLDNLTYKAFKDKVQLRSRNVVEITKTTVDGKVKRSQAYTPIEQWEAPSGAVN